jgi:hypothetical protein
VHPLSFAAKKTKSKASAAPREGEGDLGLDRRPPEATRQTVIKSSENTLKFMAPTSIFVWGNRRATQETL